MARFSEYVTSSYLPGEVYSAGLSDYVLNPQYKTAYMAKKRFKFSPEDNGDYFQQFLALQQNPDSLGSALMPMPTTPFGSLNSFAN